jgi:threonine synthase
MINDGDYSIGTVVPTVSPSMDIQVASNFERYLFYLFGTDPSRVNAALATFTATGRIDFSAGDMQQVRQDFSSASINQQQTVATIASFKKESGYLLDPHTAVGVRAALDSASPGRTFVCLATAHPAKFGDAVRQATGSEPLLPAELAGLEMLPSRCQVMNAELAVIRAFVEKNAL